MVKLKLRFPAQMHALKDHPAVKLGHWLKALRQRKGFVKRVFAGQILLTPAQYSEVEAGVTRWLGESQRKAAMAVLDATPGEQKEFNDLLTAAGKEIPLSFSNVFSREQLEPVRYRWNGKSKKPGEFE